MGYIKSAIIEVLKKNPTGLTEYELKEIIHLKSKYVTNSFKQLYYDNKIYKNSCGKYFYNDDEHSHLKNQDFLNKLKKVLI